MEAAAPSADAPRSPLGEIDVTPITKYLGEKDGAARILAETPGHLALIKETRGISGLREVCSGMQLRDVVAMLPYSNKLYRALKHYHCSVMNPEENVALRIRKLHQCIEDAFEALPLSLDDAQ